MCSRRLIVFVKNPEIGKVKTRLAAEVGNVKALEVYRQLLNFTRHITNQINAQKQVWYSSHIQHKDEWAKEGFSQYVQKGDNLGERMKFAFKTSLLDDGCDQMVLIGSDCAELTTGILRKAFKQLKNHDAVIGPAADGGYYLVGMSKFLPHIFEEKSWSTSTVFEETINDLKSMQNSFHILPELNDIDEKSDWEKAVHKLESFS